MLTVVSISSDIVCYYTHLYLAIQPLFLIDIVRAKDRKTAARLVSEGKAAPNQPVVYASGEDSYGCIGEGEKGGKGGREGKMYQRSKS
jgi:hypothetical protein